MAAIDDELSKIVALLESGQASPEIPVREILSWVYAARRGYYVVLTIKEALQRAGLVTIPDFEVVHIDFPVQFALNNRATTHPTPIVSSGMPRSQEMDPSTVQATVTAASPGLRDPTIRISRFTDANKRLISAKPDDALRDAVTKMLFHDFSQLPVMTTERDVKGVVSWNSIGTRLATGHAEPHVRDLMDDHVEVDEGLSLFDAIPTIVKYQYVLVRGRDRKITGIITSSDLGLQFQQLAEPFLLLGEIENYVRHAIASLEVAELAKGKDPRDMERTIQSSADLSFGEYIRLLENDDIWQKVSLPIDRKQFCDLLEKARQIRNDVMHFDPDGIEIEDLETLRHLAAMFQRLKTIGRL